MGDPHYHCDNISYLAYIERPSGNAINQTSVYMFIVITHSTAINYKYRP
jgi:hypothetical protein